MVRQIFKDAVPVRIGRASIRVQHLDRAMGEDAERLAPQMRRARSRAHCQMPGLSGQPLSAEDPATMQKMTINAADPRLAIRRDGRQGKHTHAREHFRKLPRGQRAFTRPDDRPQVSRRPGQGPAEQRVECVKFSFCLIHTRDSATALRHPRATGETSASTPAVPPLSTQCPRFPAGLNAVAVLSVSKIETTKNIYGHLFAQDRAFVLKAINQAVSRLYVHEDTGEDAA